MRLRAKLALVTVGLMGLILTLGGAALYLQFRSGLLETVDTGLQSHAEALAAQGERAELGSFSSLEQDDAFAQIVDGDGLVVASSEGLAGRPLLAPADLEVFLSRRNATLKTPHSLSGSFDRVVSTVEEPVEARLLALTVDGPPVIIVGASLEDQNEALARLATLLLIGGPLALGLVAWVGWVVAGAALRPVEHMRADAAAISASDLTRRLPVPNPRDELGRLGETLNEMLDRLETSLDRERRFIGEASHELRTPLANVRTELELALRRSRSVEELEAAVRSASDETERLARLAEDLLVLARSHGGRLPVRRERIELNPLVDDAVRTFLPRAEKDRITIEREVAQSLWANLDPLRIRQALGNLLDNALRHTPSGGQVTLRAARDDGLLSLEVRDTGEGFSARFLPDAFLPFARPEGARSRDDGGTGLGLAIVKAVAEAHGGEAEARNHPDGGASVELRIPEG